jgi:hypothetical protein
MPALFVRVLRQHEFKEMPPHARLSFIQRDDMLVFRRADHVLPAPAHPDQPIRSSRERHGQPDFRLKLPGGFLPMSRQWRHERLGSITQCGFSPCVKSDHSRSNCRGEVPKTRFQISCNAAA